MADEKAIHGLLYLYRIIEAGELGYAVSAVNVNNQGLKILFRAHAQQRLKFKNEILAEIRSLGHNTQPRKSIRGILHRGRINIFAALTIGDEEREMVVFKELLVGERVALRAYEMVLKRNLSPTLREIIARQYDEVRRVVDQVYLLRGKGGKRLLVKLFNLAKDAEYAMQSLTDAGFHMETIGRVPLDGTIELYQSRATTVFETSVSGAVGGALWGSIFGALAGIGVAQTSTPFPPGSSSGVDIWALVALAGIFAGAFIGTMLGFFIGIGISEDDSYLYNEGIKQGQIVLVVPIDATRITEAGRILTQPN